MVDTRINVPPAASNNVDNISTVISAAPDSPDFIRFINFILSKTVNLNYATLRRKQVKHSLGAGNRQFPKRQPPPVARTQQSQRTSPRSDSLPLPTRQSHRSLTCCKKPFRRSNACEDCRGGSQAQSQFPLPDHIHRSARVNSYLRPDKRNT